MGQVFRDFPGAINNTLAANAGAHVVVGTLSSSDSDIGDTFTYTLVTGTGDTDNASFEIAGGDAGALDGMTNK